MSEETQLDFLQEAIKKGERSRILMDMLMDEIGMSYDSTFVEVWKKLREVQDEYEEAIRNLSMMMKIKHHQDSVSVGH